MHWADRADALLSRAPEALSAGPDNLREVAEPGAECGVRVFVVQGVLVAFIAPGLDDGLDVAEACGDIFAVGAAVQGCVLEGC